jgi:broad specificity phosphatase PhoE
VLVRHGHPAASYLDDRDPGLDELGHAQAEEAAGLLDASGPVSLVTSPMRRARETAAALERRWHSPAGVEPKVAEVPAPTDELVDRAQWLRGLLGSSWPEVGDEALHRWRQGVRAALTALTADAVVFTHYLVINAAVGFATGDDRLVVFKPDHCSRTVLEVHGDALSLVELGAQRATRVV